MIIHGIEEHDLRAALEVASYAYRGNLRFREELEPLASDRQSWRVRLSVENLNGPGHRRRRSWWAQSWLPQKAKGTHRACYHAYRDFLYTVFERAPHALVVTSLTAYEGLTHFEATHRRTGRLNVGFLLRALLFGGLLRLPEEVSRDRGDDARAVPR